MKMKNLEKIIKEAISSNKCKIGTTQVMGSIKGSKLIVLSNSLKPSTRALIMKKARYIQIPSIQIAVNSDQLGKLCNKKFRIAALALKIGEDNEIQKIVRNMGSDIIEQKSGKENALVKKPHIVRK
jgi:large subunit ribosomal protein L30e